MKDKALYISGWLLMVATGFGLGEAAVQSLASTGLASAAPKEETGRVVRVVDGDTYDVLAGSVVYRVRLLGTKRKVLLTRQGADLYGRTLASVRLPVASGPALALDSLLVVRGWAWVWDPKHQVAGRAAQQVAAVTARRGLWKCGAVGVLTPRQWRQFNYKNKRRYGVGCTW